MFTKYKLDTNITFNNLHDEIEFEQINSSRKVSNLAKFSDFNDIPIVRTTSEYKNPIKKFSKSCDTLVKDLQKINSEFKFNNILAEIYNDKYCSMKWHSDQSLDLDPSSHIAIVSFVSNSNRTCNRFLEIQTKSGKFIESVSLDPGTAIIFSVDTNTKYNHRIVLYTKSNNNWMGLCFRMSITYIKFINEIPYFVNTMKQLLLATTEQKHNIYELKSKENRLINFTYPIIEYSINPGDFIVAND